MKICVANDNTHLLMVWRYLLDLEGHEVFTFDHINNLLLSLKVNSDDARNVDFFLIDRFYHKYDFCQDEEALGYFFQSTQGVTKILASSSCENREKVSGFDLVLSPEPMKLSEICKILEKSD